MHCFLRYNKGPQTLLKGHASPNKKMLDTWKSLLLCALKVVSCQPHVDKTRIDVQIPIPQAVQHLLRRMFQLTKHVLHHCNV